jgi:hypothetical protein
LPAVVAGHHVKDFWVTYDIVLTVGLAVTAWLTLLGRRFAAVTAVATALLLVVDACLDVSWAHPGWHLTMAVVRAFLVEIPIAALLVYTARLTAPGGPRGAASFGHGGRPADTTLAARCGSKHQRSQRTLPEIERVADASGVGLGAGQRRQMEPVLDEAHDRGRVVDGVIDSVGACVR